MGNEEFLRNAKQAEINIILACILRSGTSLRGAYAEMLQERFTCAELERMVDTYLALEDALLVRKQEMQRRN